MTKILIVDDEEEALEVLSDYLGDLGYKTKTALNGAIALDLLKKDKFDILILDLKMPEISGEDVLKSLGSFSADTEVIVTTGYCDGGFTEERVRQYFSIASYIEKPIDLNEIEKALKAIDSKRKVQV